MTRSGATTLREFWEWRVELTPDATFVVSDDRSWTYVEFDRWVNQLANGLRESGVDARAHVALLLDSGVDLLRVQWALQKLGAVWVPLNPSATQADTRYIVEHAEATALITDGARWLALTAGASLGFPVRTLLTDSSIAETVDIRALASGDDAAPPQSGITPDDTMAIMYTSGSTGRPKGVVQANVGFRTVAHAVAERMGTTAADRWYCVMPLFHAGGTHLIIGPAIAAGASVFLRGRFSRTTFWADVQGQNTSVSLLMPAMLSMLMTNPPRSDDRDNPLRVVFSHVRHPAFVERFDVDVCPGWGLTETMGVGALTPAGCSCHPAHSIGFPNPPDAEIKVVSPAGQALPLGERGELCVRHPHVFRGYYRDRESTARTLRDGWLYTGDVGSLDAQGRVYFHGRIKNVIKRAGENIAGEELEVAIMEHPAVEECVVCSVPDPIRTEEVHATVAVRSGQAVTERDIAEWCASRLADWKIPRYIRLVDAQLPKLANGKTDRISLRSLIRIDDAWDRSSAASKT
jgi:crotonobetaine/carnitine-CoA ligase